MNRRRSGVIGSGWLGEIDDLTSRGIVARDAGASRNDLPIGHIFIQIG